MFLHNMSQTVHTHSVIKLLQNYYSNNKSHKIILKSYGVEFFLKKTDIVKTRCALQAELAGNYNSLETDIKGKTVK